MATVMVAMAVAAIVAIWTGPRGAAEPDAPPPGTPPRRVPSAAAFAPTGTHGSAAVLINSAPPGATVLIDGRSMGRTPCTVTGLPAEEPVELVLSLEGYASRRQEMTFRPGREARLNLPLTPLRTGLRILTRPERASVLVDGIPRGTAPLTVHDLEPGAHTVRAEHDGHHPVERTLMLQANRVVDVDLELRRRTGSIALRTDQAGVRVLLDGKQQRTSAAPVGEGSVTVMGSVEPGPRLLKVSKPGYETKTYRVNVEEGKDAHLVLELKREFAIDYEVRTHQGAVHRGRLLEIMSDGTVRLEVAQGRFRVIPAGAIAAQRKL